MRARYLTTLFVAITMTIAISVCGCSKEEPKPPQAEKEIWELCESLRTKVWVDADHAYVLSFMHEQLVFWPIAVPFEFQLHKKHFASWLETLKPGTASPKTTLSSVGVCDDVAIVFFLQETPVENESGETSVSTTRVTNIWKREGEKWLLVGMMEAPNETRKPTQKPPFSDTVDGGLWSEAQKEVWSMNKDVLDCMKRKDFDGVLAVMHPQYVGWSSNDAKPTTKEDFKEFILDLKKKLEQYTIFGELFPYSVKVYEDVAVVFGLIDRTFEKPDGTEKYSGVAKWTTTWKKEGGKWLLLGQMDTPYVRPEMPNPSKN